MPAAVKGMNDPIAGMESGPVVSSMGPLPVKITVKP
jgi:hypothetical protein